MPFSRGNHPSFGRLEASIAAPPPPLPRRPLLPPRPPPPPKKKNKEKERKKRKIQEEARQNRRGFRRRPKVRPAPLRRTREPVPGAYPPEPARRSVSVAPALAGAAVGGSRRSGRLRSVPSRFPGTREGYSMCFLGNLSRRSASLDYSNSRLGQGGH